MEEADTPITISEAVSTEKENEPSVDFLGVISIKKERESVPIPVSEAVVH